MSKSMFKYLRSKKARRRGIAIELAIFVIMLCFGLSVVIVTTSMIQKNNFNRMVAETTEKLDLNRIGAEFCSAVKKNDLAYFEWKLEQETEYLNSEKYLFNIDVDGSVKSLRISTIKEEIVLYIEIEAKDSTYEIIKWELKK